MHADVIMYEEVHFVYFILKLVCSGSYRDVCDSKKGAMTN